MGNGCYGGHGGHQAMAAHRVGEKMPLWVYSAAVPTSSINDTWGRTSDGIEVIDKNTIRRHRKGKNHIDAAQWGKGFTKGKHVFEVIYPKNSRGVDATIGVGTSKALLFKLGRDPVIGCNVESWGVGLGTKRTYHKGNVVKKYPIHQRPFFERFYMYLDADAGKLMFACDGMYHGTAISELTPDVELFPMVSCIVPNGQVTFIYRGESKPGMPPNLKGPPPGPISEMPASDDPEEEDDYE